MKSKTTYCGQRQERGESERDEKNKFMNNSKYIYSRTVLTNKNSYLNTNSFISVIKHLKYTSVRCITFYLLLYTHTYILHFLLRNIYMATVVTTYFPN